MMDKISPYYLLLFGLLGGMIACDTGTAPVSDDPIILVQIHDNQAEFEEINVHIESLEVRQSDGDEAEWRVVGEPDFSVDILDLINGRVAKLGEEEVEPGSYTGVRLVLGDENYLVKNGEPHDLTLPGGSSVEIDYNVALIQGDYHVLNLDFDASRSVWQADGDSNQEDLSYELIPVIRAYPEAESGTVSGTVASGGRVKALVDDTVFTSTQVEESTGEFKLLGLDSGRYDIEIHPAIEGLNVITKPDVEIRAGENTSLGTIDIEDADLLESENWTRKPVAVGVEHLSQHFDDLFGAPQYVNILAIDLTEPDVYVRIVSSYLADEYRLQVSEFGERADAVAATNGGYGLAGREHYNSGILKIDGQVLPFLREEPPERQFVGRSAIGIDSDDRWHFKYREGERWAPDWPEVEHALAGAQMLMWNGGIDEDVLDSRWRPPVEANHVDNRHPRTAICHRTDDVGVLFTVDGRHDESDGMTLRELAQYMEALRCEHAINLDGGGSTTMWTNDDGVVNHPSDNDIFDHHGQRILKTGIVVHAKRN